jgi:hypothetical protein
MRRFYSVVAVTLTIALVGCSDEEKSESKSTQPAAEKTNAESKSEPTKNTKDAAEPSAASKEGTQATPKDETNAAAAENKQSSSKTEGACLAAVAKQTAESNLVVLSSEYSEANSVVMVGVGAQRAPWRCLVSNDGVVAEITSQTNEGGL